MFRACCGNRFPLPNGRLKIKRECCGGRERFFLNGQYSDDEYISAISFITPIRVVTYTKEIDLCLRVIQRRETIYMIFCICVQYKCLRTQFVSMWYFIILNFFFQRANFLCRNCSLYLLLLQMFLRYTGLAHAKQRGVLLLL